MLSLLPERRPGGVRMEVSEAAVPNLCHPGLGEPQMTSNTVLDTAHCRYGLGNQVLPLILIVHVNTKEEDTVRRMSVDPAEKDEVLLVVEVLDVLNPVHGATV